MLHRCRMSSGERGEIVLIQAHHRKVGRFLSHKLPIESSARDVHPPKLPINGVTAKMKRVTRNRHRQRAPRTTAAHGWPTADQRTGNSSVAFRRSS